MSADYVCQLLLYYELRFMFKKLHLVKVSAFVWCSVKICVIFDVLCERRNVDKKSKPTRKPKHANYSRIFWIFLPNVIKIDLHNFELYRFKVGAFFSETQCTILFCCLLITLSFCCRPLCCFHFGHMYSFYNCFFLIFLCFIRAAISAPGSWLSCSSRLDVHTASLLHHHHINHL